MTDAAGASPALEQATAPESRTTRRTTHSVTLDQVAARAGVSPSTVSRAIRRTDLVSEATLEVVQRAISETAYVPNLAASNLASNRSGTVAALLPAVAYSVFADTVHGLESVLSQEGIQLFLGATGYDAVREEELVRAFLGRRPDGIVVVGTAHTDATRELLRRSRIPVVETWDWTEDPIDSLVGFSNGEAFGAIVEYAIDAGYRHPTMAGWFTGADSRADARRRAFEQVVKRRLPDEPLRVLDSSERGISIEAGRWLAAEALSRHPETDVLLCASDIFATGALLEAQSRGIAVPGRLAVTGFGDFELSRHITPAITTIQTPSTQIGRRAGELLLERIHDPSTPSAGVDLGWTLIARESA